MYRHRLVAGILAMHGIIAAYLCLESIPGRLVDVEMPHFLVVVQLLPGLEVALERVGDDGAKLHPLRRDGGCLGVQNELHRK